MSFDPGCIRFEPHECCAFGRAFRGLRCDISVDGITYTGTGEDAAEALARAAGEWARSTRAERLRKAAEVKG